MVQLDSTALAMIDASAEEVYTALTDYEAVRSALLTRAFSDYHVHTGGQGAGTEVSWKMQLGEKKRDRRRWEPWDCQVLVEQPEEYRLVERDTKNGLVTEWRLHQSKDGRCAVRVSAVWEGPDGKGALLERPRQRLAMRQVYEGVLLKLHQHFLTQEQVDKENNKKPTKKSATEPAPDATEHDATEHDATEVRAEPGASE